MSEVIVLPGPSTGPAGPVGPPGPGGPIAIGSGTTIGNATTNILAWTPPLNSTSLLRSALTDNGATAGQAYSFEYAITVRRDAGVPRIVGSATPLHVARDNNSAQNTFTIVGNDLHVNARGVNLQTINWVCALYRDSV